MSAVRLVTLNTWGTREDWPVRRNRLRRELVELAPDLITLQETIVTASYDQALDVLSADYHLVHHAGGSQMARASPPLVVGLLGGLKRSTYIHWPKRRLRLRRPAADSIRFWTGRHVVDGHSVCYLDAWESVHPDDAGHTFSPDNPYSRDWDWPFRRIDYVLVRCGPHRGPTLVIDSCTRILDRAHNTVSDHYGILAELSLPRQP